MAFVRELTKTPTSIGSIIVHFKDSVLGANQYDMSVEIIDQSGQSIVKDFNLESHLTAGQKTTIDNFLATIRTKAVAEIL